MEEVYENIQIRTAYRRIKNEKMRLPTKDNITTKDKSKDGQLVAEEENIIERWKKILLRIIK